jgi:hypothetical protein
MSPYESLANAIILHAVRDYREALSKCSEDACKQDKESIERFFRSDWFGVLTPLDPEFLIRRLCGEVQ